MKLSNSPIAQKNKRNLLWFLPLSLWSCLQRKKQTSVLTASIERIDSFFSDNPTRNKQKQATKLKHVRKSFKAPGKTPFKESQLAAPQTGESSLDRDWLGIRRRGCSSGCFTPLFSASGGTVQVKTYRRLQVSVAARVQVEGQLVGTDGTRCSRCKVL